MLSFMSSKTQRPQSFPGMLSTLTLSCHGCDADLSTATVQTAGVIAVYVPTHEYSHGAH